jgi:hypothetical protein
MPTGEFGAKAVSCQLDVRMLESNLCTIEVNVNVSDILIFFLYHPREYGKMTVSHVFGVKGSTRNPHDPQVR